MPAATTDTYKKVGVATVTTLSAPGKALSATSITVGATTNFPSDTGIVIAIRQVDSAGELVPGTYTEWSAIVSSGTTFTIVAAPVYGTDQVYPAGSTTQVYVPVSSYAYNKLVDGLLLAGLTQAGGMGAISPTSITTSSLTISGSQLGVGWTPIGVAQSGTIVNNGNRSYDIPFASTVAGILTPGMRLRIPRTVAAPTQSTSLNGTTQYYSKTTPAGMTFTDDFVAGGWVKLTAYGTGSVIISRYNGTSGWSLRVAVDGTVGLTGFNGSSANNSFVSSFQSIPLNKWVHVAAQLDMSAFTATTTTSYIMIDGVNVPASVSRGGTNPTALVQAGNLEVGTRNASEFFPGKIAQAFVFTAKVTQATMQTYMSQGFIGTETSLGSAYSFNNSILDLNTTNANNLTANGSAVATNADSPFGQDANGVPGAYDFAIVTKVVTTTATVQVPEGNAIPTSGGVGSIDYSVQKAPFGFPIDPGKWRIGIPFRVQANTTSNATYGAYNSGGTTIAVSIGAWIVGYCIPFFNATTTRILFCLSSTDITGVAAGNEDLTFTSGIQAAAALTAFNGSAIVSNYQNLAAAATYKIYTHGAITAGGIDADNQKCELFAEFAYL